MARQRDQRAGGHAPEHHVAEVRLAQPVVRLPLGKKKKVNLGNRRGTAGTTGDAPGSSSTGTGSGGVSGSSQRTSGQAGFGGGGSSLLSGGAGGGGGFGGTSGTAGSGGLTSTAALLEQVRADRQQRSDELRR